MKIVPGLAAAFVATIGASSATQAALINFSAVALCPVTCTGITYSGPTLGLSTAINLDGSTWVVAVTKPGDNSGLIAGDPIDVAPKPLAGTYGTLSGPVDITLPIPITKTWTGTTGPEAGDSFVETLTKATEIDRGFNEIGFTFTGTVTDTLGFFDATPASMELSLTQAGGPKNVVSASLTNSASTVPEPATWVMMGLGFIALGYAAVRGRSKNRSALAI
jgi:hypothetical protein